jgi:hypothetical protein
MSMDIEDYGKTFEEYKLDIEKLLNEISPKANFSLLIVGFLLAVAGVTSILAIGMSMNIFSQPITNQTIMIYFSGFVASFFGYMLVHKSTENDWL